jgi:hypothetical protein
MPTQQITPVRCPTCGAQFTVAIEDLVNGQDMALKSAFLQGYFNAVQCPQCGSTHAANVPTLYYDLEKELAYVWVPTELTLAGQPQEKIIGNLTNRLVNSLPAEQRKFYLFNPRVFLTQESMVKAVLEADGITEEMIQAQRARAKLIEEFLQARDEASLKQKIKERDAELDSEFFEMLTYLMQQAQLSGDQRGAQTLLALRTFLRRWSSQGKKAIAEIDKKLGLVILQNQEELLDRLQQAKDEREFEALVAAGHPLLDYGFFQKLTAKIDAAAKKGDQKTTTGLRDLRAKVLDVKAKHEERSRAALERASNLLKEILQSGRPDRVIEQKLDQIDEAFFYVLRANIEAARQQGHTEPAQALEMIGNIALSKLHEKFGQPEEAETVEEAAQTPQEEKPVIHIAKR